MDRLVHFESGSRRQLEWKLGPPSSLFLFSLRSRQEVQKYYEMTNWRVVNRVKHVLLRRDDEVSGREKKRERGR